MSVACERWVAAGNAFLVVDAAGPVPDRAAFAAAHCRAPGTDADEPRTAPPESGGVAGRRPGGCGRRFGTAAPRDAGRRAADGVLFLGLEPDPTPPRVVMTLVQPDGSRPAMCGNGARVAAAWAARRTGAASVMVDTQAGTRAATVENGGTAAVDDDGVMETVDGDGAVTVDDGEGTAAADDGSGTAPIDDGEGTAAIDGGGTVSVEMGRPSTDPEAVPVAGDEPLVDAPVGGYRVTAVDAGVPHAVALVDDVAAVDVAADAPAVRHADVFPEGANVTFAAPRPDGGFDQRTFERGVEAETRACGTGAVAIVAVAAQSGLVDHGEAVPVSPPGGDLTVTLPRDGPAVLRGPVERAWRGERAAVPPRSVR